jgi:hypothetical protein
MNIVPTELNEDLAKALRGRISAEGSLIFGKVGFWHLAGTGLVIFGMGIAIGLGCYGYAQIIQKTGDLNILSSILSNSLSDVRLKATADGTVQLEPQNISLAEGQTVTLASDSHVSFDRSATIKANGEVSVQLPSISVPPSAMPKATESTPLITNFTVFKAVEFGKGTVMTGWSFLTSAQTVPTHQYCYYTASLETPGFDVAVDIADDGKLDTPKTLPRDFDLSAAYARCVWFKDTYQ